MEEMGVEINGKLYLSRREIMKLYQLSNCKSQRLLLIGKLDYIEQYARRFYLKTDVLAYFDKVLKDRSFDKRTKNYKEVI